MEDSVRGIAVHRLRNEGENAFQQCVACGQKFDKRSLAQVLHHKQPDHRPFSDDDLKEFATAREQAR